MEVIIDEAYTRPGAEFGKDVVIEGHVRSVPGFMLDGPSFYRVTLRYYARDGKLLQEAEDGYLILTDDFVKHFTYYDHFEIQSHLVPRSAAFVSIETLRGTMSERAPIASNREEYEIE